MAVQGQQNLKPDLYLVVIAGGSGTRFWPKSTSRKPKQLLSFTKGAPSLLIETLKRFESWIPQEQQIIVTTLALKEEISIQAPFIQILAEPEGRNTAPSIYWAARFVSQKNPKAVMVIMPSDHSIVNIDIFTQTLLKAAERAKTHNELITLGVRPTRAEIGYGYLHLGEFLDQQGCQKVIEFTEKPSLGKAVQFFQSGKYLWNGGMFLWRAEIILKAFDQFMPEMQQVWESAKGQIEIAYPQLTATSIDYGIMEKSSHVVTYSLNCGWDDLGSWTSLEGFMNRNQQNQGSDLILSGEVTSINSTGNIIDVPGKLVALLGVQDFIIVENEGVLLIARKERAQDIRQMVEKVKEKKPELI